MKALALAGIRDEDDRQLLQKQHQLRARVFGGRLGWQVDVKDGLEIDVFDSLNPTYILAMLGDDELVGCARLLPSAGPTMLANVFTELMTDTFSPHPRMVESSRFCVDTDLAERRQPGCAREAKLTLFAGILEWCLSQGHEEIVTVTDLRFERILARAGWRLHRIGPARQIGVTNAVAGVLPVNGQMFTALKPVDYGSEIVSSSFNTALKNGHQKDIFL